MIKAWWEKKMRQWEYRSKVQRYKNLHHESYSLKFAFHQTLDELHDIEQELRVMEQAGIYG